MKNSLSKIALSGLLALSATHIHSAAPDPYPPKGPAINAKLAFSHDGNSYDPDDWGAVAFTQAIAWAFGKTKDIVHLDYNDNTNILMMQPHYENMIGSVKGAVERFKIDPNVVFDDVKQAPEAVANFVRVAGTLSATNRLFYMCAGPMEIPWRCINATPMDKRPFITCVSHSTWNEEFNKNSHTWANMKALPGGTQFIDISDQNGGLGKNSNWDAMLNFNETMTWLQSRATLPKGATNDVSDCGMTWYAMTGEQKGTPAMVVSKLKWAFGNPTSSVNTNLIETRPLISVHQGRVEISQLQPDEYSKLIITNLAGKSLQFSIGQVNKSTFSIESSKLNTGLYYLSLQNKDGKIQSIGRANIFN